MPLEHDVQSMRELLKTLNIEIKKGPLTEEEYRELIDQALEEVRLKKEVVVKELERLKKGDFESRLTDLILKEKYSQMRSVLIAANDRFGRHGKYSIIGRKLTTLEKLRYKIPKKVEESNIYDLEEKIVAKIKKLRGRNVDVHYLEKELNRLDPDYEIKGKPSK